MTPPWLSSRRYAVVGLYVGAAVALGAWTLFPSSDLVVAVSWGLILGVAYGYLALALSLRSIERWRRLLVAGDVAAFVLFGLAALFLRSADLGVAALAAGLVSRLQRHLHSIELAGSRKLPPVLLIVWVAAALSLRLRRRSV